MPRRSMMSWRTSLPHDKLPSTWIRAESRYGSWRVATRHGMAGIEPDDEVVILRDRRGH